MYVPKLGQITHEVHKPKHNPQSNLTSVFPFARVSKVVLNSGTIPGVKLPLVVPLCAVVVVVVEIF